MSGIMLNIAGGSFGAPPGQDAYITAGTFSWVAPAGVTKVSAVVVGPAFTATGGALAYTNNISVTSGSSYTVKVLSASVFCGCGYTRSYFIDEATVSAAFGSLRTGTCGGNGGSSRGGAGGYSGNGGAGANCPCISLTGAAGSGGGGGGGGIGYIPCAGSWIGAGGGVGLLGQGSNGAGGTNGGGGGGGSGGANGGNSSSGIAGSGGSFGGAAGFDSGVGSGTIGPSAVRIIWPGCARSFPSTRTANE